MTEQFEGMTVFRTLEPSPEKTAIALSMFDGLHLGHREVISLALRDASRGLVPTVFTFAENPKLGGENGLLLSQKDKIRILAEMGVRRLYLIDFESVRGMAAEDFVGGVLKNICRAETVCCGFNYTFGRGGTASSEELHRLCAENGMAARVAPPVLSGGEPVSSTRIRALIREGNAEEAASLLGRPFGYEAPVVHGRELGRRLGTPTLNQHVPPEFVQPRFGVYASVVEAPGLRRCGVTNVGVKPTVGSDCVLAETWMPGYTGPELYGRTIRVGLLKFLRPEQKFQSLSALREAIARNGVSAQEYFRQKFPDSFET